MSKRWLFQILLLGAMLLANNLYADDLGSTASEDYSTFDTSALLTQLASSSFVEKESIIEVIAKKDDDYILVLLKALSAGRLYWSDERQDAFVVEEKANTNTFRNLVSGELEKNVTDDSVTKITVNNKLRGLLKRLIAAKSLSHPNAKTRINAIKEMKQEISPDSLALFQEQLGKEQDPDVRAAIQHAAAYANLDNDDKGKVVASIKVLAESTDATDLNRLKQFLEKDNSGSFSESDPLVRAAAAEAVASIEKRLSYYEGIQTVYYGISLGSVLLLSAIGLAITFGVMGVINMAHGELMMLGAYTTYVVQQLMPNHIDQSLWVAIPAAFIVAGLVGIAIERGVIRFLYGRPLETLLATFGISLILQQLVRTIFSPLNKTVETPSWMAGTLEINSALALTYNRMAIIVFSLVVFALLVIVLRKTALGLHVRAVSQNRPMAAAMGIRTSRVDILTFGLGSGVAGVAGVALSQLTNVGPNLGQAYIVDSFMVVVFGGVGNLWGTLVGSMSLGLINKVLEPWSGAVLAKIVVLIGIILFIQKRPRGLFPQKGRVQEA